MNRFKILFNNVKGKPGMVKWPKNRPKRGEESETYPTLVCRQLRSIERSEPKHENQELSANTVVFIICTTRLTTKLAGTLSILWSVYFYSWWKYNASWKLLGFVFSHWSFYTPQLSTDISQIGVVSSPLYNLFFKMLFMFFRISKLNGILKKLKLNTTYSRVKWQLR